MPSAAAARVVSGSAWSAAASSWGASPPPADVKSILDASANLATRSPAALGAHAGRAQIVWNRAGGGLGYSNVDFTLTASFEAYAYDVRHRVFGRVHVPRPPYLSLPFILPTVMRILVTPAPCLVKSNPPDRNETEVALWPIRQRGRFIFVSHESSLTQRSSFSSSQPSLHASRGCDTASNAGRTIAIGLEFWGSRERLAASACECDTGCACGASLAKCSVEIAYSPAHFFLPPS